MTTFKELTEEMNLNEMKKILESNSQYAKKLIEKINSMETISKISSDYVVDSIAPTDQVTTSDVDEEEEYEYYYNNIIDAIKKCGDKNLKQAICDNLPVLENKNYTNIIKRIIFELLREKEVYASFLDDSGNIEKDALEEQKKIDEIIKIVKSHHTYKEKSVNRYEVTKNNLIFFRTPSGNIYAESDLASIDSEYYQGFKDLLESIENGTFSNARRFASNHRTLHGISEVKDHGIRVVFDRINVNTYIILDIFIKRSDCDKGYVNQLVARVDSYKKKEDYIKSTLTDTDIEEGRIILENLKQCLDNKCIVKARRGER